MFRLMRAAVKDQAELMADLLCRPDGSDLRVGPGDGESVPAIRFRLDVRLVRTAARARDGCSPKATISSPARIPYAVLSYDYWTRRFGQDPKVIGRTFRMGNDLYQIVGVGPERFTGTETRHGDRHLRSHHDASRRVPHSDWTWMRTLARVKPGVAMEPLRAKLDATSRAFEEERAKGFAGMSKQQIDEIPEPEAVAGAGGGGRLRSAERLPHFARGSRLCWWRWCC